LSFLAGEGVRISFTPHLLPMSRGILSTVYAGLWEGIHDEAIRKAYEGFYGKAPFVRLCGKALPSTLQVRGSNFCDIGWKIDEHTRRLIIVSVIDNLTRGASGQAVCNMNLMCGLPEEMGLDTAPWQP
jgi:N-acetyl-gamma-glutamyl-phosphate reductase